MFKKLFSIILCSIMVFNLSVSSRAEFSLPASLEGPTSAVVRDAGVGELNLRWTNPKNTMDLMDVAIDNGGSIYYLIDWKINDGPWNITPHSQSPNYNADVDYFNFLGNLGSSLSDDNQTMETFFVSWHFDSTLDGSDYIDLKNDTYSFRVRYVLLSYDSEFDPIYSPYSEVTSIGKNSNTNVVTKLDAPKDLTVIIKKTSSGKPYFQLDWTIPNSISETNKEVPVYHCVDFKVGNGKWHSELEGKDSLSIAPSKLLLSTYEFDAVEKEYVEEVIIEENTYYFRILFRCDQLNKAPVYSPFSNIVSTKVDAYSNASSWAKPELDKADEYGLIPPSLIGADMTKDITREEFAELAVVLYEATTGITATPADSNTFPDTKNPEILKANNLGIVSGYGDGRFGPKDLINREQVASMLHRAIQKMVPTADFSITGAPVFKDDKSISSWALNSVKYIAKSGIILGSDGKFMPKATTDAEVAAGYASTTREQAILMGVRTFEKFKN